LNDETPRVEEAPPDGGAPVVRRREAGGWEAARWARRAVQIAALVLFVYLLFAALQRRAAFPYADLFFRLDPLAAFGTMLAARLWLPHLALAAVTVGATLVLGRVWCGWICPLGTLLEWVRFKRARMQARRLPPRLPSLKYLVLTVVLTAALLGNLTLLILDPLALLTRATGTAVVPGLDWAVLQVERGLYDFGFGQSAVSLFEQVMRGRLLPTIQPAFQQAVPIFLLLLAVVLLNRLADRFWCRFLCPLGALLGLVSKVSLLRPWVGPACERSSGCAGTCRQGAISVASGGEGTSQVAIVVPSECVVCLDCLVACGDKGMSFGLHPRPAPRQVFDPGRRQFLTAMAGGAAGVVLLGAGVWNKSESSALIRPPGAQDEGVFLSSCVRCGQCLRVCPTSGLQPAFEEAGIVGLWTPVLKSRLGYCDYGCNACGRVCPVEAIPRLPLEVKRRTVIGLAWVDRDRCLPWAYDTPCIVCQEVCPLPDKAVRLNETTASVDGGGRMPLQRPIVVRERCIGCGLCEYHCPVSGAAAIQVVR